MPAFTHCQGPGCSNPLTSGRFNRMYCSTYCRRRASNARENRVRPGGRITDGNTYRITETPEERAAWMARFASPEYAQQLLDIAAGVPSERDPIDPDAIDTGPGPSTLTPQETHEKTIERVLGFNFQKGRPHDDSTT